MTTFVLPPLPLAPGTILRTWVSPDGVIHDLPNDGPVTVEAGARGEGLLAPKLSMEKTPFSPGKILRYAETEERTIELHFLIRQDSGIDMEQFVSALYGWFYTASETFRTPGIYRVTRRDGTQRQIACYYTGGLEGDTAVSVWHEVWYRVTVELTAPDPWPTDVADATNSYVIGTEATFTVINTGQIEAYPRWTIHGPFTSATFANTTRSRFWTLNINLAAGGRVTIDTRPAASRPGLQVYDSTGVNQFANLTAQSDLWSLSPANNLLNVSLAGISGPTAIDLAFLPTFWSLMP